MIASHASPFTRCGGVIVAALLAAGTAVFSPVQAGQPVKLVPPSTTVTTAPKATDPDAPISVPLQVQSVPLVSSPQQVQPPTTLTTEQQHPIQPASETVRVGALAEIDPSSVGLLDPGAGGMGIEMWQRSERSRIERLIQRLPMGTLSVVMQDLSRRLLLSAANVPEGTSVAPSFLGLRVERLAAGGQTASVNQLLRLVSTRLTDPAFARAEMDGLLLGSNRASFCTRIGALVAEDPDPYWLKGLAFCKALEGETEGVELAIMLLRESGETSDEAFFILADALTGGADITLESLIDPTPLQLAMLRAAKLPLPADAVPGARPGILGAQATWANADIELRLEAAEKAEAAGVINAQALAQNYAGIEFSEEELTDWLGALEALKGPRANALLYQISTIESDPQKRTKALVAAWRRTTRDGGFATMARVTNNITRSLAPSDDLVWAATDIVRALIAANDFDSATRWFNLVREIALSQPPAAPEAEPTPSQPVPSQPAEAAPETDRGPMMGDPAPPSPPPPARPYAAAALAVLDMWPLMQLADFDNNLPLAKETVAAWWSGQVLLKGANTGSERAALLYTLLDSLDYEMSDELWDPLLQGPLTVTSYLPSPALSRALIVAAEDKRIGETVLLALLALGDVGPAGADPSTLHAVIRALRAIGLSSDARRIAIEAALGRGL